MQPYRIVIASIKGGTCKTTTAVSLAALLARYCPALLVDFDPQGQVASHFGLKQSPGVSEWLLSDRPYADCLQHVGPYNLAILPGDQSSKHVGYKYGEQNNAYALAAKLDLVDYFNFHIYDTAAGGFLQEAALIASHHVIIPFRTEGASVASLKHTIDTIKSTTRPDVPVTLLPVSYQKQYSIHRRNLAIVMGALGDVFTIDEQMAVPHRVGVIEAFSEGETIWDYKDNTLAPVRAAYARLAAHVFAMTELDYYSKLLETHYATQE